MPRQSGYRVTIRGFLPADRKSLDDTARAISLLRKAEEDGAIRAELVAELVEFSMEVKPTSREVPVEMVAPPPVSQEPF